MRFTWLTPILLTSFLISTSVSATRSFPPVDCEHDMDCLLDAAKTCTQARMTPHRSSFSRAEWIEIQGKRDNQCLYYAARSTIQHRGFACQFYSNDGLVSWLEMISRRRRVIYDSRKAPIEINGAAIGQRTIETINGKDVGECIWR